MNFIKVEHVFVGSTWTRFKNSPIDGANALWWRRKKMAATFCSLKIFWHNRKLRSIFVNILIINIWYRDNLHACKGTRRVLFFALLAGAPSLGTFPYSINVLPTKRCWFSVTLVWSPYVYSPMGVWINLSRMDQPVCHDPNLTPLVSKLNS